MDLKQLFFVSFIVIAVCMPFVFSKKQSHYIPHKVNLPNVDIQYATFMSFNPHLARKGEFSELLFLDNQHYNIKNVNINFLDKNTTLNAKTLTFHKVYHFNHAVYTTNQYTYTATNGSYDDKTHILHAHNFQFFSKKIYASGDTMTYTPEISTAKDIYIKYRLPN
ncbi:MAG: hypothetical protein GXO40_02940 [Epsilonproteobacteria bacterium]|nr:hypothetical protein [Campylobacterota bacterium]